MRKICFIIYLLYFIDTYIIRFRSNIYLNNIRIKFVYIFKIIFVHIKYEI